MKTRTAAVVWSSVAALGLMGFKAASDFRPPKTAVVDITKVFDGYLKTIDRQKTLTVLSKDLDKKAAELRERYQELESDIKLMQPGTEQDEKKVEMARLKIKADEFQRTEVKALRRDYFEFLREIREEISKEIDLYAESADLDLVLEKSVTASEAENGSAGFKWPIVHYVKPELQITQTIVDRLNQKYKKKR